MSYVLTSARMRRRRGLADAAPAYNLIGPYGPHGNVPPDPSQIDIPTQLAIQSLAGPPSEQNSAGVHTYVEWCSAYRSVTGRSCPSGDPFGRSDFRAEFWTFWSTLAERLGWPLQQHSAAQLTLVIPHNVVTTEQFARLYPQLIGVPIDPAQVAVAQAAQAEAGVVPPVSGAPAASSTNGAASSLNLGGLLQGSALGIPAWAWVAGGVGLLFLFGRGR